MRLLKRTERVLDKMSLKGFSGKFNVTLKLYLILSFLT
ncbi:MAG: hypothetical protein MjAS7_0946 [Metallosphaera javensis (ex Sakai et al. 2022)]|nr:MAG: hypothetical protein MjAS7_0946 [Metallosphaera javensis (ex Sakai et al. 2022)]